MAAHSLLITRSRTDEARVTVVATTEAEAKMIAAERAQRDELLWEEQCVDVVVMTEAEAK